MAQKVALQVSLIGERLPEDDLEELGLEHDTNHMKIEFNHTKSARYRFYHLSISFCIWSTFMWVCLGVSLISISWIVTVSVIGGGLILIPCILPGYWYNANAWAHSRLAAVTDSKLVEKQGSYACCCCCWNEKTKSVPLDKITDLRLEQGWLQRCFNIQAIAVQTASSGGAIADISLIGLYNPRDVRKMILKVKEQHGLGALAGESTTDGANPLLPAAKGAPQQAMDTAKLEGLIVQQSEVMVEIKDVLQDMKNVLVTLNQNMENNQ
eukprot:407749_1